MSARVFRASLLLTALLPAAAFASPDRADSRPKRKSLALIAVTRGDGFSEPQVVTIEEVLLAALDRTGKFKVIGRADISALISLEATKQKAGCTEDTDCMVQIAGALGVDFVATADVGRLGKQTILSLKVIDVRTAVVVARAQEILDSDAALAAATRSIAGQVVDAISALLPPDVTKAAPISTGRGWGIGTLVLGAVTAGAGAVFAVLASQQEAHLKSTQQTGAQVTQQVNTANSQALTADVLFGVGGALGITGVTLTVVF